MSRLDDLPRLPRDADGPVFAEPWQAQAFALAVKLSGKNGPLPWLLNSNLLPTAVNRMMALTITSIGWLLSNALLRQKA